MKKIKIFGISAAIMMILLALTPMVCANEPQVVQNILQENEEQLNPKFIGVLILLVVVVYILESSDDEDDVD